jgi:hypothetical protein
MLDKAIEHGKEYRRQYTGAKLCDRTCRNHGSCPQCKQNRTFSFTRNNWWSKQELREYKQYSEEKTQQQNVNIFTFLYDNNSSVSSNKRTSTNNS